ncbi:hypothetical protein [Streptomyces sp. CB01881]|uniref:hypothetical protein n=1 Tax=Streptomyces sp. CB01881 TaxID=2078691 RepID=UPI000CDC57FA|nr:hypothetical protein [Streptomyces sp. CB01881]AUY53289.1 hypothetical protein C2142_35260 [Streptomyces sp. CB01881]TYC69446.1 hypothetical protein EH183_35330 [Streptomyces sp. CB01881]
MRPWTTSTENGLRHLLDEWDPVGAADDVQDEYDCMLAPVVGRLHAGARRREIGASSWHEPADHFGFDPLGLRPDARAGRVVARWTAVGPGQGTGSA